MWNFNIYTLADQLAKLTLIVKKLQGNKLGDGHRATKQGYCTSTRLPIVENRTMKLLVAWRIPIERRSAQIASKLAVVGTLAESGPGLRKPTRQGCGAHQDTFME